MLDTRLDEVPIGPPAACVWQGRLVVAWADTNRGGAISVAVGDAVTATGYAPSITQLAHIAFGFGTVALAEFSGRLYLGWMEAPTKRLMAAASTDGVTFAAPFEIAANANDGPSLHGGDQLYASWIESGSRRIVVSASVDGLFFTPPLVLSQSADAPAAFTSFDHPFHGHRVALVWGSGTDLFVSTASATSLQGLDAAPLKVWNGATPAVCLSGPPVSASPGPTIALRADDRLGLLSVDIDGSRSDGPLWGPLAATAVAVAAVDTDLLLAFGDYEGDHRLRVGSWADVFGIPPDLKARVGARCDPRQCTDDPRLVCVITGEAEIAQRPAEVRNARRGDLVLTPADGDGVIGTILKHLAPHQFYDHMGIMVADGTVIRHCTESKDRLMSDKSYYTGSLLGDPAPTAGLRPDLVKYGWPGPITQSVQDGFFDGWNGGLNPQWGYAGIVHGEPTLEQRLAFFDREHPDTAVRISNLTYTPSYRADHDGPLWPVVVRPPRDIEAQNPWVRWTLERVAEQAATIHGHYRFYAYSDAQIGEDATRFAPPVGDAAWAGLATGADWAAGTPGLVCSTFVWLAARQALAVLLPPMRLDLDPASPQSGADRVQTVRAVVDGLYEYHIGERTESAEALHDWIVNTVRNIVKRQADSQLPGLARVGIGLAAGAVAGAPWGALGATLSPTDATDLVVGLTHMPEHVANGVCNAFAYDTPEKVDEQAWKQPGIGKSVSPDDILNYWDPPGGAVDARHGLWGESERMMLAAARPELTDVGKLALSPGVAHVTGVLAFGATALVGGEVAIGCRKAWTNADGAFALDVPASPDDGGRDQLIRFQCYWPSPPGMVSRNLTMRLAVGPNNLGRIELHPPPEWRRRVEFHGGLEMTHQVMFGHDSIGHKVWSASRFVQSDPAMTDNYRNEYLAALQQPFSTATERYGGQRAQFSGVVSMFDATAGEIPPEGPLAVRVDWRFGMWDGNDGDEDEIDHQAGQVIVAPGTTRVINPSLRDASIPPDRAHAEIAVDNLVNPA